MIDISYVVWAICAFLLWIYFSDKAHWCWQVVFLEVMLIIVACAIGYAVYEVLS